MTAPQFPGWVVRSDDQAKATLTQMQRMVRAVLGNHDWLLFARGIQVNAGVDMRNAGAMAYVVRDYVSRRLRFVRDPVGIESLTPPMVHMRALERTRGAIAGDCDDAATLSAALALAVGIPATYTIVAFDWKRGPTPYQHVFTTLYPKGAPPLKCDTTRNAQKFPPKVARTLTITV